jgi:hypothetical protein
VPYVTLPEFGGLSSACSSWSLLKEFVVELVQTRCFRFSRGGWLALATAILLAFALGIALLRFVFWLFTRERDADASEKDYWRIHG